MLKTGAISQVFRFKNNKLDTDAPNLVIYVLEDMSKLQTPAFKALPQTHSSLPGGGPIQRFVDFDTRYYQLFQTFQTEDHCSGTVSSALFCLVRSDIINVEMFPALIAAGVEPAVGEDEDLDKWYREEHLQQATTQPGWKRTTRYKLLFQVKNDPGPQRYEDAPNWLALHEWEKGFLGEEVLPFEPMSEWTKSVMGKAKLIQAGNYERVGIWKGGEEGA